MKQRNFAQMISSEKNFIFTCPSKIIDRDIGFQSPCKRNRLTFEGAFLIRFNDHDFPFIRFEPWAFLGPVSQIITIRGKHRGTICCEVFFGQIFPLIRSVVDGYPAEIHVGAPRFILFRHCAKHKVFPIR